MCETEQLPGGILREVLFHTGFSIEIQRSKGELSLMCGGVQAPSASGLCPEVFSVPFRMLGWIIYISSWWKRMKPQNLLVEREV